MFVSQEGLDNVPGKAVPLQDEDRPLLRTGGNSVASFQEFEGSTLDAWDERTDEIMEISTSISSSSSPTIKAKLKIDKSKRTENENSCRLKTEAIASNNETTHQPREAGSSFCSLAKKSKSNQINIATLNKLSEELVKANGCKSASYVHVDEGKGFVLPPMAPSPLRDRVYSRLKRFGELLSGPSTDLDQLRNYSWNGIPNELRGKTWRLLTGYMPPAIGRRQATLKRKRLEYQNFVEQYYPTRLEPLHEKTFKQIRKDVPRMNHLTPICEQEVVQEVFLRILFIWAIRHPASGYVQGINDFVVPFFVVFLGEYVDKEVETLDISNVPKDILDIVEADTFWCVTKLLDGIQDNYTFNQPGIQMKVNTLKNLVSRINGPLDNHISSLNIEYLQFTFRWMNNLLMRELPLKASIRLWDTYWAEPDGFAIFHLYVCAALLKHFADEIMRESNNLRLMKFLLQLPCKEWQDDDVSCLVSEAYQLRFMFADAPQHLKTK